MEMQIIEETDEYVVIDKPSGVMVHGDGRSNERTVADWVYATYPSVRKVGEPLTLDDGSTVRRPGIVHRLDRDTSGVLVIAKTDEMFAHLKAQFQNREVQKEYRALVWGVFRDMRGVIDESIGRSASDFRKWTVARGARGKVRPAYTTFRVLQSGVIEERQASLLAVFPKTGRTHQIRVHMKYKQHPIVCDSLYGFAKYPCPEVLGRLALHAHKITFEDGNRQQVSVTSPVPESFTKVLRV